jgi:hypothetical protein
MGSSTRNGIRRGLAGAAVAVAAMLLPAAAQASNPISGGKTTLKLDRGTAKVLSAHGVSVKPIKPAKARGGKVSFPVTGGKINARAGKGEIKHSGGLAFRAGGKSLRAKSFQISLNKGKLTAKVGKARVPLLKLNAKRAKLNRKGLAVRLSGVRGSLTAPAAKALNATFGVRFFKKGVPVGKTTTLVKTKTIRTVGGETRLTLDPGAAAALSSLGISAAPIDPASARPDGSLAFPITGGRIDSKSFAGRIGHSGGIALSDGSTTVALTRFDIQVDGDPDLTALVGSDRVSILDLDLSGLRANVSKRGRVTLANVVAALTPAAADALNAAFGTTAFSGGLVLGTTVTRAETG